MLDIGMTLLTGQRWSTPRAHPSFKLLYIRGKSGKEPLSGLVDSGWRLLKPMTGLQVHLINSDGTEVSAPVDAGSPHGGDRPDAGLRGSY